MLNLHLKRMCARVITSLSALGIVSIAGTNGAEAANYSSSTTYENGESFTYTSTKGLTFTAKYNKKSGSCTANSSAGVSSAGTYATNSTNTSATCTYKCDAGKFFNSNGSTASPAWATGFVISGTPGTTMNVGSGKCEYPYPTCATVANATSTVTSLGTNAPYMCTWTCKNGYTASGANVNGNGFTGVAASLTIDNLTQSTTGTCKASTYTVTFDCTTSGKIAGTSSQTATKSATYGQSFTVDKSCTPVSGWTFTGWKGN